MADFLLTVETTLRGPSAAAVKGFRSDLNKQLKPIDVPVNVNGSGRATKQIGEIDKATKKASRSTREFAELIGLAGRRFAAYTAATAIVIKLSQAIKNTTKEAIAFELELARIAQVQDTTISNLASLNKSISRLSTSLGLSANELAGVARIIAQTGRSGRELEAILEAIAKSSRAATFDDMASTADGAIAVLEQFNIAGDKTQNVLDQINAVTKRYAVESRDIIEAVKRGGAAFANASKDVESGEKAFAQFVALFTSVRSTTRESADAIGTAFKTLFGRVQRRETIDYFKTLGVELETASGRFVGAANAIQLIGDGLRRLNIRPGDVAFAEAIEQLGGLRQIGRALPLITQTTKQTEALAIALNSAGSIAKDVPTQLDTISARLARLSATFDEVTRNFTQNGFFQEISKMATTAADAVLRTVSAFEQLLPLIGTVGLARLSIGFGSSLGNLKKGLLQRNTGGIIPGSGNRDTVPALLTPGEVVLNDKQIRNIGKLGVSPKKLFNQIGVPGFNTGGVVGGSSFASQALIDPIIRGLLNLDRGLFPDVKGIPADQQRVSYPEAKKMVGLLQELVGLEKSQVQPLSKEDVDKRIQGLFNPNTRNISLRTKATTGQSRPNSIRTIQHEVGHDVDFIRGAGLNYSSEIKGTFENELANLERRLTKGSIEASGSDQDFKNYRLEKSELYANFIAKQEREVYEILATSMDSQEAIGRLRKLGLSRAKTQNITTANLPAPRQPLGLPAPKRPLGLPYIPPPSGRKIKTIRRLPGRGKGTLNPDEIQKFLGPAILGPVFANRFATGGGSGGGNFRLPLSGGSRPPGRGPTNFGKIGQLAGFAALGGGLALLATAVASATEEFEKNASSNEKASDNVIRLATNAGLLFALLKGISSVGGRARGLAGDALSSLGERLPKPTAGSSRVVDKLRQDSGIQSFAEELEGFRKGALIEAIATQEELTESTKKTNKLTRIKAKLEQRVASAQKASSDAIGSARGGVLSKARAFAAQGPGIKSFALQNRNAISKSDSNKLQSEVKKLASQFGFVNQDIAEISKTFGGFEKAAPEIREYLRNIEGLNDELKKQEGIVSTSNERLKKVRGNLSSQPRQGSDKNFRKVEAAAQVLAQRFEFVEGDLAKFDTATKEGRIAFTRYVRSLLDGVNTLDEFEAKLKPAVEAQKKYDRSILTVDIFSKDFGEALRRNARNLNNKLGRGLEKVFNALSNFSQRIRNSKVGKLVGGFGKALGAVARIPGVDNLLFGATALQSGLQNTTAQNIERRAADDREKAEKTGNSLRAFDEALTEATQKQKQRNLNIGTAVGAAVGSIFGPFGTAIGGFVGAIAGANKALTDFIEGLPFIELEGLSENRRQAAAAEAATRAKATRITKNNAEAIEIFNKRIQNASKAPGLSSSLIAASRDQLLDRLEKELNSGRTGREEFKDAIKPLADVFEKELADKLSEEVRKGFSVDEIRQRNQRAFSVLADSLKDLIGAEQARTAIDAMVEGIVLEAAERQRTIQTRQDEIRAIELTVQSLESLKKSSELLDQRQKDLDQTLAAVSVAGEFTSQQRTRAGSATFGTSLTGLSATDSAFTDTLRKIVKETPEVGGIANQVLDFATSIEIAKKGIVELSKLDAFKAGNTQRQIVSTLESSIGKSFSGVDKANTRAIFNSIAESIASSDVALDPNSISRIVDDATKDFFDPLVSSLESNRQKIEQQLNQFTQILAQISQRTRERLRLEQEILKSDQDRQNKIAQLFGQNATGRTLGLQRFERASDTLSGTRANILGRSTVQDLNIVGASLAQVNKELQVEAQLRASGNLDAEGIRQSTLKINKLGEEAEKLRSALDQLGDVSAEAAQLEDRLNRQREKQRLFRGAATGFAFGTSESRQGQIATKQAADFLAGGGSIQQIPEQLRSSVQSLLRQFENIPIFKGQTGREVETSSTARLLNAMGVPLNIINTHLDDFNSEQASTVEKLNSLLSVQTEQLKVLKSIHGNGGFAGGGSVVSSFQPKRKGTDTVPAMLTPGEFVVNRKSAQANKGLLHAINSGVQYYQNGGTVDEDEDIQKLRQIQREAYKANRNSDFNKIFNETQALLNSTDRSISSRKKLSKKNIANLNARALEKEIESFEKIIERAQQQTKSITTSTSNIAYQDFFNESRPKGGQSSGRGRVTAGGADFVKTSQSTKLNPLGEFLRDSKGLAKFYSGNTRPQPSNVLAGNQVRTPQIGEGIDLEARRKKIRKDFDERIATSRRLRQKLAQQRKESQKFNAPPQTNSGQVFSKGSIYSPEQIFEKFIKTTIVGKNAGKILLSQAERNDIARISGIPIDSSIKTYGHLRRLFRAKGDLSGEKFLSTVNKMYQPVSQVYSNILSNLFGQRKGPDGKITEESALSGLRATGSISGLIQNTSLDKATRGSKFKNAIGSIDKLLFLHNQTGLVKSINAGSQGKFIKDLTNLRGLLSQAINAPGFASGGLVGGRPGVDSNMARLTKGEFVLNRRATQSIGKDTLDKLNNGVGGFDTSALVRFSESVSRLSNPIATLDRFSDAVNNLVGYKFEMVLAPTQVIVTLKASDVLDKMNGEVKREIMSAVSDKFAELRDDIKFGRV